jgi:hypothetical protein
MLTGRRTFDEPTREQMIKRRLTEKAPHPRELGADIPKTLDLIVARMLNRTPPDRYATAAEVRDLLIPAIALEGGFDDPSWRAPARSNPTVFIQAAEQPTQEMTPYPGVVPHRRIWRRPEVLGAAAVAVIAMGAAAAVVARNTLNERARTRVLEQAVATKPPLPAVITVPAPSAAQLPKTGASAAARLIDSALPAGAQRPAGASVSPELQQPIEQLRVAIESRLPSKMEEVYRGYDQDELTKKYFRVLIDKADSIHVKSIKFQNSNVRGNTAELNFRMILSVTANASPAPSEVPSTWRADLVREGQRAPWKLQKLTNHRL